MSNLVCNIFIHGIGSQYLSGSVYWIGFITEERVLNGLKNIDIDTLSYEEQLLLAEEVLDLSYHNAISIEPKYAAQIDIEEGKEVLKNKIINEINSPISFVYYDDFQINNPDKTRNITHIGEAKVCKLLGIYHRFQELNQNKSNFNWNIHLGEDNVKHREELNIFIPEDTHRPNNFVNEALEKSVYIDRNCDKLFLKNIPINKSLTTIYGSVKRDVFFKKQPGFYFPLNRKVLSFVAANGTGKTLLTQSIQNYFAKADTHIYKQIFQPFSYNDSLNIINYYSSYNINYMDLDKEKNLYLFSLNNIINYKFDYLLLPNLDYILKYFTITRVFNDYIKNHKIDLTAFRDSYKKNTIITSNSPKIENSIETQFRLFFKENLIFEEIKENDCISLIIFIIYQISLENNLSLEHTIDCLKNEKNINLEPIKKYLSETIFIPNGDLKLLKIVFKIILEFDNNSKSLGDYIIDSVNNFKLSDIYKLFKNDFENYENYINHIIKNNEIKMTYESILVQKHYSNIFDTILFYPEKIIFSNKEIKINNFIDEYNTFDRNSIRSIFSIIEKNGSEFEKNEYKLTLIELFFNFLIQNLNPASFNKIIILSDDLFTQTDNHNVLLSLLRFNDLIENNKDLITWINFTHSFSFFQTFNRTLNIERENLYLIKKEGNHINFENLPIKNKLLLDYLNKQSLQKTLSNEEKLINLYSRIIYRRFICEHNKDISFKTEENLLTKFLHFFPHTLNLSIDEEQNSYSIELKNILLSITGSNDLSYDNLFEGIEKVLMNNFSHYKEILDIEITFILSVYIRFLIEKYIYEYIKNDGYTLNTKLDYTGNLLEKLKLKDIVIYNSIKNIYNLTKNYIHHDYINYEYLIFVNPNEVKNEAIVLKNKLLALIIP